ncbi:MAG TPA: isoaspartyl peptidase/L-asparaginase [Solirubrobacteraceae bacterium]|jgi:beta-aspartyl-peptidase (threonine type)|nr:isoaspartyl peptidase/L-asparaginase [Solirubrobacteraceae bacterium]
MRPVVVVHAGAGSLGEDLAQHEQRSHACLLEAMDAARSLLADGRAAVVAAQAAVEILESFELFNAGHGSTLCADGSVQMSAALMRGSDRAAGAVAGVRHTRHPIAGARVVLDGDQVLMIGEAADALADAAGLERWANDRFITARQRGRLLARRTADDRGTVGAVCLDGDGDLAAATSTGGVGGQPPGRVGDSPLIGAGTWADPRVAVSCTGAGESFIRAGTARRIATLLECDVGLTVAAARALADVAELDGHGGLIAVDAGGQVVMPFTTEAMPRGMWRDGEPARAWVTEPGASEPL